MNQTCIFSNDLDAHVLTVTALIGAAIVTVSDIWTITCGSTAILWPARVSL